jgi:hypothetical protein
MKPTNRIRDTNMKLKSAFLAVTLSVALASCTTTPETQAKLEKTFTATCKGLSVANTAFEAAVVSEIVTNEKKIAKARTVFSATQATCLAGPPVGIEDAIARVLFATAQIVAASKG